MGSFGDIAEAVLVAAVSALCAALLLHEFAWNSCGARLRRAGRPAPPGRHQFGRDATTPDDRRHGLEARECERCGYIRKYDRYL